MSLVIYVFGDRVRVGVRSGDIETPIDLGDDAFILGLLTRWNLRGKSCGSLAPKEICQLVWGAQTGIKDPTSNLRKAKARIILRLKDHLNITTDNFEEVVSTAEVDAMQFREILTRQIDMNPADPHALEQALLMFDDLFGIERFRDATIENTIIDARHEYNRLFSQGVRKLMEAQSPLIHNVVAAKTRQIKEAPELTDVASALLRGSREALRRNVANIALPVPSLVQAQNYHDAKGRPTNLSDRHESIYGRDEEIWAIHECLKQNWLVSLTGVGGSGKTTLLRRIGRDLLEREIDNIPDGVWFIDLVPVPADSDTATIARTILSALGLKTSGDHPPVEVLLNHLHDRHLVLLLDNCEHLETSTTEILRAFERRCPYIKILLTTRVSRGDIWGEQIPILPLNLLDPEQEVDLPTALANPALCLFQSARQKKDRRFVVDTKNLALVIELCHITAGIPLAIEIVARTNGLLKDILESIQTYWRKLPPTLERLTDRHQTMAKCIAWSYHNLTEKEQALFRRLAPFSGGWTLEIAREVCSLQDIPPHETFQHLTGLCDSSLVFIDNALERYRFLEPVRAFAEETLDASGEKEEILEGFEGWLKSRFPMNEFMTLGTVDGEQISENMEGLANLDSLADQRHKQSELRAFEVELYASAFRVLDGSFRTLRRRFAPFRFLVSNLPANSQMQYYLVMAVLDYMAAEYADARHYALKGTEIAVRLADRKHEAVGTAGLGVCEVFLDIEGGQEHIHRGLKIATETGDSRAIGIGEFALGAWHWHEKRPEQALPIFRDSLTRFRQCSDKVLSALLLNTIAHLERKAGYPGRAARAYIESYKYSTENKFRNARGLAGFIMGCSGIAATLQRDEEAARFWGSANIQFDKLGARLIPPIQADYDRDMAGVKCRLGTIFEQLSKEGAKLSMTDASEIALRFCKEVSLFQDPL